MKRSKKKFGLNNKGFSLVELLAVMAILAILFGIGISAYTKYREKTIQTAYDTLAESASDAATNYVMDHPAATEVTLDKLYEDKYLENVQDPRDDDNSCTGKVRITKIKGAGDGIDYNTYDVSICCDTNRYKYDYTYSFPTGIITEDDFCRKDDYDIKKIKDIKVLNVYPVEAYKENVKNWMNNYGKSDTDQIISVTPVSIEEFNTSYAAYLGTDGAWKYDVIIFGFADSNGGKDLSAGASDTVKKFLESGGSAIFGHDTIRSCFPNFAKLAKFVNIEPSGRGWVSGGNKVVIRKKSVFTDYPNSIGDVGTVLTIPTSHVTGQVFRGDVWLKFTAIADFNDGAYLTTYGNNAMIQTGHSNGAATDDEQKIIANIVFAMYAKSKHYM